ncbi:MAG: PadR family transcriptional regulator [Geminicoccaceae bacterium]|nr:PadR family transcriptional regulator [Geminicoccaceae bacterium]
MDVKTLCLGVLSLGDHSGYEIKKHFEQAFRHFYAGAGFGSIYPALADLAAHGLVEVCEVAQESRPAKKVYSLTPAGLALLQERLLAAEPRQKVRSEFLAIMYFGHLLPAEHQIEVLDRMIREWERFVTEEIAAIEQGGVVDADVPLTPGMRFALGYGRTVRTAALAYCRRHRDQLMLELKRQGSGWTEPAGAATAAGDRDGAATAAGD